MIQSRAMLATLSISAWTARKQDKKVSVEIESTHGAHDAGRYHKLLVSKALLDPITRLTGQIREYHYFHTLAWADSGARLLPTKLFMNYSAKIREFRDKFEKLVREFQAAYPAEVQAARVRLGTMYSPADYPDVSEIVKKFGVSLEFTPVPDARDFRVDVSNDAREELHKSVTAAVAARQADAIKSIFERVREVVSKIDERLSMPEAIFKASLFENAGNLWVVIDALNITDDPRVTEISRMLERLALMSPVVLRVNPQQRLVALGTARDILAKLP